MKQNEKRDERAGPKKTIRLLLLIALAAMSTAQLSAQWVKTSLPATWVPALLTTGTDFFAGTDLGLYHSTDGGQTWSGVNIGSSYSTVHALVKYGTTLFAGTESGAFRSTDGGATWIASNTGFGAFVRTTVYSLAVKDSFLFCGTYDYQVYRWRATSSDWYHTGLGQNASGYVRLVFCTDSSLFASASYSTLYRSRDDGASWQVVPGVRVVLAMATTGGALYASDATIGVAGVYRSTDNGTSWTNVTSNLQYPYIFALAGVGTNLFASSDGYGVSLTTNGGGAWTAVNEGFPLGYQSQAPVYSFAVVGNFLFWGTNRGLWRRPLSEMIITGVEEKKEQLPAQFALEQNYPNPFNPTTTIRYALPHRLHVTLAVYNTLGQEVTTLVNGDVDAGYHSVQFDGSNLTSGIYYYRLQAGSFVDTKKLVLVK